MIVSREWFRPRQIVIVFVLAGVVLAAAALAVDPATLITLLF